MGNVFGKDHAVDVKFGYQNQIEDLQRQLDLQKQLQKQELETHKTMIEQQVVIQNLERLKAEAEQKALAAIENEEQTTNKCQYICNAKFQAEFGATVVDFAKAPRCYKALEDHENLSCILSNGKLDKNPLSFPENQELIPMLHEETGWEEQSCKEVINWYLDPELRIAQDDKNAIEELRVVTDIATMNFEDLEDQDHIVMAVDNLFADLNGTTRELLRTVAVNCMSTVKKAASLKSLERCKSDQFIAKVDDEMETITIRIRTVLCFKYLVTSIQNQYVDAAAAAPQVMGDDSDENEIVERQPEDARVAVAFRTTVHQMKTVKGSMNQKQSALVAKSNLF